MAGFVPMPGRSAEAPQLPLPHRVRKTLKSVGLNIREHQEMKAALRSWQRWMSAAADRIAARVDDDPDTRTLRDSWASRCRGMARRLGGLLRLPLFEGVADRNVPVLVSSLYRRVPAYAEFFSLNRDLSLGIAQVEGEFLNMPIARTFDLYELWCFLRILRAAATRFPIHPDSLRPLFGRGRDGSITVPSSFVEVDLGGGYSLAFQRTYKEFWNEADSRGSFSRHMRPDLALTAPGAGETRLLVVLDAKYRVGGQLNDAVADIHMYRDALVEPEGEGAVRPLVCAAYLLTPQVPVIPEGADWRPLDLKNRLFHPEYRSTFRFGAATLRPGMPLGELWGVIEAILTDAGVPVPAGEPNGGQVPP